jgi:hypothetical protein
VKQQNDEKMGTKEKARKPPRHRKPKRDLVGFLRSRPFRHSGPDQRSAAMRVKQTALMLESAIQRPGVCTNGVRRLYLRNFPHPLAGTPYWNEWLTWQILDRPIPPFSLCLRSCLGTDLAHLGSAVLDGHLATVSRASSRTSSGER